MDHGTMSSMGTAALSVDVEDWFHVQNLSAAVPRATWPGQELRVPANMDRMLALLSEHGVRATCFVLGAVAERCPDLVRRIVDAGHEVACHGLEHHMLSALSPDAFREDVRRSKTLLEDITGTPIRGYRAPNFSITDWAIPILAELGFSYDSSLFAVHAHDRYGSLTGVRARDTVVELSPGFHEMCVSTLNVAGREVPWGGGAYFRVLPYRVFRGGVRRILASGAPYVFYIHPWEIDPGQPRVAGLSVVTRFRHYARLGSTERRLERLLGDFRWTTLAELLEQHLANPRLRAVKLATL
jgi:polysaccharide deacetylase family protein (PEP-CTERM system associated)